MSGVDLEKLKGLQFDVSKVNFEPPRYTIAQSAIDDMNKRTQQITVDLTRVEKNVMRKNFAGITSLSQR